MIPKYQECMLPLLLCFKDKQIHSLKECTEVLSNKFNLSTDEKAELLPSGNQPIMYNRVGWAKFYLEKAGLLKGVTRGKYVITEDGLRLLSKNPQFINNETLSAYKQFRDFINNSDGNADGAMRSISTSDGTEKNKETELNNYAKQINYNEQTPEEILDTTFKQLQANLANEVLEKVLEQSPQFFEKLVVELLVKMGYGTGKITGRTGDGGIDGIIDEDRLGLDVIHIQAKRWQIGNNVGRRELQHFVGALDGEHGKKGVFITTSSFTREALEYNPVNVKLAKIDGKKLANLMIAYNVGVSTNVRYEIKKIDTDYFEE